MKLHDKLLMEKSQEENRKITLTEVAAHVGVDPSRLYQILMGKSNCSRSPGVLEKVGEYFGMTEEELCAEIAKHKLDRESLANEG